MATQFDFKSATPDATFPSGAFLFGADSQSASDPSIYSSDAYLSYILTKTNSWTGAQTFTLQTTIPVGSLGTPSIVFAGSPNAGLYSANAGNVDFAANGAWIFRVSNGSGITAESGSAFNWSSTGGNPSASKDTGISRVSAGVVGIGTGASGSVAGSLSGAAATLSGSAPQVTLGVNTTTLGSIKMFGNTSGDVTLQPSAAAGTATTLTLPATTSTLAGLAIAQTFTATQTITPAANTNALAVTGYSVTGSGTTALFDLAGTWNTSGVASGLKINITDTASNALSGVVEAQYGGSTYFRVGKGASGYACLWLLPGGTPSLTNIILDVTGSTTELKAPSGGTTSVTIGDSSTTMLNILPGSNQVRMPSTATFGWTSGSATDTLDTTFLRNAAAIIAPRGSSSTTPAAFNFYTYGASPPSAPSASMALLYADTSGGKIRLMALFPSGAAQQIAIEP